MTIFTIIFKESHYIMEFYSSADKFDPLRYDLITGKSSYLPRRRVRQTLIRFAKKPRKLYL